MSIQKNFNKFIRKLNKSGVKNVSVFTIDNLNITQKVDLLKRSLFINNLFCHTAADTEDFIRFAKDYLTGKDFHEIIFNFECLSSELNRKKLLSLLESGSDLQKDDSVESLVIKFLDASDEIDSKHGVERFNSFVTKFPSIYDTNSLFTNKQLNAPLIISEPLEFLSEFYVFKDMGIHSACYKITCNDNSTYYVQASELKEKLYLDVCSSRGSKSKFSYLEKRYLTSKSMEPFSKKLVDDGISVFDALFKDSYFKDKYDHLRGIISIGSKHYDEGRIN